MTSNEPLKSETELPVPIVWRTTCIQIADRLAVGDYRLDIRPENVGAVTADTANFIASQIASYGDELVELSDETWERAIYLWMDGYWQVVVDLCTKAQGVSDLAMFAKVFEQASGFHFEVEAIYVP